MHSRAVLGTSSQPCTKFFRRCFFWSGSRSLPWCWATYSWAARQKAARAAGRIADRVVGRGPHAIDDALDEFAGREILPRTLRATRRHSSPAGPRRCRL